MAASKIIFDEPQQKAVAAVLKLMAEEKMRIVNCEFFSRIERTPFREISKPEGAPRGYDHIPTRYLETTVDLYCRDAKVATVTLHYAVELPRPHRLVFMSAIHRIRYRKYYWRNDSDESRERGEESPGNYEGVRWWGPQEQLRAFEDELREAIS